MEREYKFSGDDPVLFEALTATSTLAGYPAGPALVAAYTDVYLDTGDRRLFYAGYACRLRRKGDDWLVTLKGLGGASGALHEREEYEAPATPSAAPGEWPQSEARGLAERLAGDMPLDELFTLRQARTKRMLGPAEAPVAELSLDEVQVEIDGAGVARYREVEAEQMAGGTPEDLTRIGEELRAMGLRDESLSKFERALQLLDAAPPLSVLAGAAAESAEAAAPGPAQPAARAKSPGVTADDLLSEAARKILRFHFERMLEREGGARQGDDLEDVHRMRVATRRMRAAVKLFEPAFTGKALAPFNKGLRVTGQTLGAVRDLDVMIEHAHKHQSTMRDRAAAGLEPLLDEWNAQRQQARAELVAYLDSGKYRRFAEDFRVFLDTERAGAVEQDPLGLAGTQRSSTALVAMGQVRYVAGGLVWQRYEAVRVYGAVVKWAPVEILHALRIESKYLRYLLEFLKEVLGPATPTLIEEVVALQDHFGALHDADVAVTRLREFLMRHGGPSLDALTRQAVEGYLLARQRDLRLLVRGAPQAWRKVGGTGFRYRLARDIASL